ncbi:MAG TPA: sialidase family protein [Thermomicrobiales bacterium]|nr:sialidase family protein [Thermomicrobiales bacterium]
MEVISARTLVRTATVRHRNVGSLARLDDGRILLAFRQGTGPLRRNDGAVMLSHSDDDGVSWSEPVPLYAHPGWDCLLMGGLAHLAGDRLRLILGRVKLDFALGGPEPLSDWYVFAVDSDDGGRTWSDPGPEIRLFPCWTELYGTSNPHPLPDGRYLWACMGTLGRDTGWQAGVTVTGPDGRDFSPPVIIAAAPDRDYADLDLIRLADGRFLAVIREFVTKESVFSHSADDGRTWSPIRPTGFKAANIKLHRLRSGAILCLHRDEDPSRPGVSCHLSKDNGETWRFAGQLYAAEPGTTYAPGCPCGYPDLVSLEENRLLCVLHTYPDAEGNVDLHLLHLVDRS